MERITEEFLLNNGFEYSTEPVPEEFNPFIGNNFGYDFYSKGRIKFQSHYISYSERTLSLKIKDDYYIQYVHQLQDYFHSIGGRINSYLLNTAISPAPTSKAIYLLSFPQHV